MKIIGLLLLGAVIAHVACGLRLPQINPTQLIPSSQETVAWLLSKLSEPGYASAIAATVLMACERILQRYVQAAPVG